MDATILKLILAFGFLVGYGQGLHFKRDPAPDGHRCGVCPTYLRKICAFNAKDNSTYIFDNHCVMDLYNCIEDSCSCHAFVLIEYEHCLYFGNFAYVHGYKYEDVDYEDKYGPKSRQKNPSFVPYKVIS